MTTVIIVLLVIIIITLSVMILVISRRSQYYKIALGNMSGFAIMQRMFELMASSIPAANKIEELNNIIIEVFNTKNSTISIFDGVDYEVKATNVENIYKEFTAIPDKEDNCEHKISLYCTLDTANIPEINDELIRLRKLLS